jgi:hypothetical protein
VHNSVQKFGEQKKNGPAESKFCRLLDEFGRNRSELQIWIRSNPQNAVLGRKKAVLKSENDLHFRKFEND